MLADILVGPMLRRLTAKQLVLWWVSPRVCQGQLCCFLTADLSDEEKQLHSALIQHKSIYSAQFSDDNLSTFQVGESAVIHLLDVNITLPSDTCIEYDLLIEPFNSEINKQAGKAATSNLDSDKLPLCLVDIIPHLTYDSNLRPSFIVHSTLNNVLHGSCRNPHHSSQDNLVAGDSLLKNKLSQVKERPALLIMSGDQVYADHVAGVTLHAIHQVIALLGLFNEKLHDDNLAKQGVHSGQELYQLKQQYFNREKLLPVKTERSRWYKTAKSQAIFSSTSAHNHLITFAENVAMYFLVWSPVLWQQVSLEPFFVPKKFKGRHQQEFKAINAFIKDLPKVQRLLAHVPSYMIFDDHDVTDDWNLSAAWEQAAYQQPLSKRIIGNSLIAYWLCQAWGNDPNIFKGDFWRQGQFFQKQIREEADNNLPSEGDQHDQFVDYLLGFSQWHYSLDTEPKLVVIDSRTQRWRSENSLSKPSGLMDWESLCELQQSLIGHNSILLVSPAPIFGVKLIETLQRMATIAGQPLAVDAENWMAHRGAANTLLNIFKHPKTPQNFVILSGDVHYSFVYDVELRFREYSPKIWQITSSGIKNQFPQPLLSILDRVNRWFYGTYSPLNLFTKRRSMRIKARKLLLEAGNESVGDWHNNQLMLSRQRLQEKSGLGLLSLNTDGSPRLIADLHYDGSKTLFIESSEELIP